MQNLIKMYHVVPELSAFHLLLTDRRTHIVIIVQTQGSCNPDKDHMTSAKFAHHKHAFRHNIMKYVHRIKPFAQHITKFAHHI